MTQERMGPQEAFDKRFVDTVLPAIQICVEVAVENLTCGQGDGAMATRRSPGVREGVRGGFHTMASPPNGGDAMIGRETRVLLRPYLEQGMSKAVIGPVVLEQRGRPGRTAGT